MIINLFSIQLVVATEYVESDLYKLLKDGTLCEAKM